MLLGFDQQDTRTIYNLFLLDLRDRHLGSVLGLAWAVIQPLMMLCIYTFVFGFLFQAKAPGAETTLGYTAWMIAGLGPWLATAEGLLTGANSVVAHSGLVKNVPMKTEMLPIVGGMAGLVSLFVTLVFLLTLSIVDGNYPSWHALYLLPAMALQFLLVVSLAMFLAPVTVFVRDLTHALPSILMIVMFLTPIFYSVDLMPGPLRIVSHVNPFFIIAESYREPLIYHRLPPWWHIPYVLGISLLLLTVGLSFFRRVKMFFDSAL